LNRAHLDYFYWLLAGLCVMELVAFFFFSRAYVYKKKAVMVRAMVITGEVTLIVHSCNL
jgi:hypothetical protein